MTISWRKIGIEWNKLIFVTYVRQNRFTKKLLDKNAEFTINIPLNNSVSDILKHCGTTSGKIRDKISELNLDLVESRKISVPVIKQLPLTLECKVIYKQLQDKDYHIAFYGEVVDAYIIK